MHWGPRAKHCYLKYNTYETNSKGTTDSAGHPADLGRLWISPRRTEPPAGLSPCPCSAVHRDLLQSPNSVKCWGFCLISMRGRQEKQETAHRGRKSFFSLHY